MFFFILNFKLSNLFIINFANKLKTIKQIIANIIFDFWPLRIVGKTMQAKAIAEEFETVYGRGEKNWDWNI